MFCNKCGAQLADTAAFCNKCGASLQSAKRTSQKSSALSKWIQQKNKPFFLGVLFIAMVLVGVVICVNRSGESEVYETQADSQRKSEIYGTWTDSQKAAIYTYAEDGSFQMQQKNDMGEMEVVECQFEVDDKGNLTLLQQAWKDFKEVEDTEQLNLMKGMLILSVQQYVVSEERMVITDEEGQRYTLYRIEDTEIESFWETMNTYDKTSDIIADTPDVFQSISLYGTWMDSSGVISFTFQENGTIRIGGLSDTLGADLFTFTEVDNDTLQLKADSDNMLLSMISLNLNYEISGNAMTVEIAGQTYQLIKQA